MIAFTRNRKIRPFKIMEENDQHLNAFKKLREAEEVPVDVCPRGIYLLYVLIQSNKKSTCHPSTTDDMKNKSLERFMAKKDVLSSY